MTTHLTRRSPVALRAAAAVAALGMLAACGTSKEERLAAYQPEKFSSTNAHSRSFPASEAKTCEAARRAMLSQGYQVKAATGEEVSGNKSFQPDPEVHMEVQLRVVCAPEAKAAKAATSDQKQSSTAFVSALQDRYGIKKVNNSASVGVGVLGSFSLPYSSSEDAMVKLASETVSDEQFYDRFYALMDRYLTVEGPDPEPPKPLAARTDANAKETASGAPAEAGASSQSKP
ncbi:DUF2242 domain-containing protein [Variovorax dokdonensis]|uniref:DUF2242 domain-containing protein n=1 Tax=Variovorax dokdonensis TaxID=344883 RepID=A0ABT7NGJ1_9BURK|nr:DUF2242 domain-containing protein [Variovorax dokdonensis]MDM0046955.1 DUF2242 domain-containing protein [Variovorax dokdonensis]